MFSSETVNLRILRERAYNLRWATLPADVIPFTAADPDFPCAPEIAEAIVKYSTARYFSYGPPDGLPAFKESVANFFNIKRNVPAAAARIMPIDSAAYGIYLTAKAFLDKGDEAIIFDPVDFLFRYSVEVLGGVAKPFAIAPGTDVVDFSAMESLISPKTKMICLCNPLNPTGKVFTKAELTQLGEIAVRHNLIILSDEIWSDIIFSPHHFTSIASLDEAIRKQTIIVTGYSKSYGLAGLRIGSIAAFTDAHFKRLFETSLHQSTVHGSNTLGQIAALTGLNDCDDWLNNFVSHLQKMRDIIVPALNGVHGFSCIAPEGCYVAFADITGTGKTSSQIKDFLLDNAKVAVVPGLKEWFGDGATGFIRLSFATSESIVAEGIQRIKNAMNR